VLSSGFLAFFVRRVWDIASNIVPFSSHWLEDCANFTPMTEENETSVLCSSAVTWWFLAELSDELVVPPEVLLHHMPDHLLRGHLLLPLLTCPAHAINQSIHIPNPRKQQNPKVPFYLRKF
jgi:hypothetical protein